MSKIGNPSYEIKNGIISNGTGNIGFLYVSPRGVVKMNVEPSRGQRRKRSK